MIKIYPSLMNSHLLNLAEEVQILEPYCDGFHIDAMDFDFVKNIAFGPDVINKISKLSKKQLFIHLMVKNPQNWLDILNLKQNDIFSFHFESIENHDELIKKIMQNNLLASVALNPKTEISVIFPFVRQLYQVLIMSVEPGFSGQKFIELTFEKVSKLNDYKKTNNLNFRIAVDGGINKNNFVELIKKGGQDFAMASAIFSENNPINALEHFYGLAENL